MLPGSLAVRLDHPARTAGKATMRASMSLELRERDKARRRRNLSSTRPTWCCEEGSFNVLLGTTLAGKTTLMQLMAGLEQPTQRARSGSAARTSPACPVQKRNVSMVYQQFINYPNFTVYENIASPLRVAGIDAGRRSRRGCSKVADLLRLTPMLQAPAERTVRRPAAAHRDRPRPGQGFRPHPARRAARQSRLQAARGIARRIAEAVRRPRLHRRLCHDRADRGAALRRQHRDPA